MPKTLFEVQYSQDGEWWLRYVERFATIEEATKYAQSRRYETNHTRTVKVICEVVETFPAVPGKKAPPMVLGGLGRVDFVDSKGNKV